MIFRTCVCYCKIQTQWDSQWFLKKTFNTQHLPIQLYLVYWLLLTEDRLLCSPWRSLAISSFELRYERERERGFRFSSLYGKRTYSFKTFLNIWETRTSPSVQLDLDVLSEVFNNSISIDYKTITRISTLQDSINESALMDPYCGRTHWYVTQCYFNITVCAWGQMKKSTV